MPAGVPEILFLLRLDTNDETLPPPTLGPLVILGPRTPTCDCPEVFLLSDALPLPRTMSSGGVGLRDPSLVGEGLDASVLLLRGVGGTTEGMEGVDTIVGGGGTLGTSVCSTGKLGMAIGASSISGGGSLNIGRGGVSSSSGEGSLNDGLLGNEATVAGGGGGGTRGTRGGGGGGDGTTTGAVDGTAGSTNGGGCSTGGVTGFTIEGIGGGGGGGVGCTTGGGGSATDRRGGGESTSGDFLAKEGF